jgi:hypothetical protein
MTDDVPTLDGPRPRGAQILSVANERGAHRVAVFGALPQGGTFAPTAITARQFLDRNIISVGQPVLEP